MYAFLVTLFVIASILLVVVILLQASKGGGLASNLGGMAGGGGVLGTRGAVNFLQKATVTLAVTWGLLCLLISFMSGPETAGFESATQRRLQEEATQQQQAMPQGDLPVDQVVPEPVEAMPQQDATQEEENNEGQ
ncbi:MAG: preprotein translocase subunit SecG [Calditrichaeota bacterium]|nr:preprotein translocase subunit SecG [Calditrichota bacterium]HQU74044.1 preprotein translocase subunit SecG [Calditrichia bacterium]